MKRPLDSRMWSAPPGSFAIDGAVARRAASNACMIAMPSIVRAIPADRNQAETAPTAAAMISMENAMPLPSSLTIVVHIVRNDAASATPTPNR